MGIDDILLRRFGRTKTLVGAAVLTVVLLVGGTLVANAAGWEGDSGYDPNNEREAIAQCEGFADKRLKAPADADYDLSAKEASGGWVVTGTVDSPNSFGANVRADVECELHFENDLAVLDNITVG